MFFAQLNDENICVGISDLSGEVVSKNMIKIDEFDVTLLGKKYNNGSWEKVALTVNCDSNDLARFDNKK